MTSQHCVPLSPEVKILKSPGKEVIPSKSAAEMRYGYRTLYLGSIPTTDITSTESSVSLLLDRFRLGSINDEDIFLDAKICGLIVYFVDNKDKIVKTKMFDLARISYCSGDHKIDPCIFAWVYHQETRDGFRHECHAVKASSERKARYLAVLLNNAFTQLYHEVQAALSSSRLFHQARCVTDKNRNVQVLPKEIKSILKKPPAESISSKMESKTKDNSCSVTKVSVVHAAKYQSDTAESEPTDVSDTEKSQDSKSDTKDWKDCDVITKEKSIKYSEQERY